MPAIGMRPWTPQKIATEAWYDASDLSTVIHTTNPGRVEQWSDKSGKGNHLTETTLALKPSTGTRTLNGKNIIDFNDTFEERLRKVSPTGLRNTDYDVYAVAISDLSNNENLFTFRSSGKGLRSDATTGGLGGYFYANDAAVPSSAGGTFTWDANPHIAAWAFDGSAISVFRDGTVDPNISDKDIPDAPASIYFINLCTNDFSAGRFDGAVAEFIITPHLSSEDRQKMEGYLAHKWGLTANLPSTHPFKHRPPTDSSLDTEDWDPTGISTYMWFDAADASTITHSGGAVSQWNDKSGNARHASQGTGSLQPTTGTRHINDKNAMNFDPTEYLNLPSFNFMGKECYAVFEMDALDDFEVLGASGNTQVSAFTQNGTVNPPQLRLWAGPIYSADTKSTSTLPLNQVHMAGWLAHNPKQYSVNGTWQNTTDTPTELACNVNAILRNQFNNGQDGIIGEIIVMDGVSGTEKRQKIEGYLAHKWGLTANLPSDHPYKTKKPQRDSLWTPSKIATAGWYDASDTSTITQAGGLASQWNDKSGNGNHLAQGTGANQPSVGSVSGRTVLQFAESKYMDNAVMATLGDSAADVFIVYKADNTDNKQIFRLRNAANTDYLDDAQLINGLRLDTSTGNSNAGGSTKDTIPHIGEWYWDGANAYQRIDGIQQKTLALGGVISGNFSNLRIGANVGGGQGLTGYIGEVIVTATAQTTANRQKIEGYLAWKWGFPHQLPDTHPYKRRPPMV